MRAASQGSGRSRSRRSTSATSPFPRNHRPMKFPLLSFSRRVLSVFRANQGLLLAMAIGVVETAVAMIVRHRAQRARVVRPLLVAAVIPYFFVMALAVGLLLVTLLAGALEAVGRRTVDIADHAWSLVPLSRALIHLLGVACSILMLTALYMIMPVG